MAEQNIYGIYIMAIQRFGHVQDMCKVVELKTDAELGLKLQEDHHRITEAEIKKDCCYCHCEV